MKKLAWFALGLAMVVMINCPDNSLGTLGAEVTITAQPIGGQDVDFLAAQFQVKDTIEEPPAIGETEYHVIYMHAKWRSGGNVLKDSVYAFDAPGTFTQATFLYAPSGHFLNGQYMVEITWKDGQRSKKSDTAYCTVSAKNFNE